MLRTCSRWWQVHVRRGPKWVRDARHDCRRAKDPDPRNCLEPLLSLERRIHAKHRASEASHAFKSGRHFAASLGLVPRQPQPVQTAAWADF